MKKVTIVHRAKVINLQFFVSFLFMVMSFFSFISVFIVPSLQDGTLPAVMFSLAFLFGLFSVYIRAWKEER